MAKDPLGEYSKTDKWGAPTETEVLKAQRFVFWHKWSWIAAVSGAAIWGATMVPVWIVWLVLLVGGIGLIIAGAIWLIEKDDAKRRILRSAKQLGVRKDV